MNGTTPGLIHQVIDVADEISSKLESGDFEHSIERYPERGRHVLELLQRVDAAIAALYAHRNSEVEGREGES